MESQRQKRSCDGKKPAGLCGAIWTTCCSNSMLVGTMAWEGALGVPVRSHSKSRQTPLPDRCTLWLGRGSSNEVSKRILDGSCSLRFPFPPSSVRVYLQVSVYKTCLLPLPCGGEVLGDVCSVSGHCGLL